MGEWERGGIGKGEVEEGGRWGGGWRERGGGRHHCKKVSVVALAPADTVYFSSETSRR